jgi:hypothetical protein
MEVHGGGGTARAGFFLLPTAPDGEAVGGADFEAVCKRPCV